jgi:hypothetical protein
LHCKAAAFWMQEWAIRFVEPSISSESFDKTAVVESSRQEYDTRCPSDRVHSVRDRRIFI